MCKNTNEGTKTNSRTVPRASCSVTLCPPIPTSDDFVIEPIGIPFACCKEPNYSVCKHQDIVFKVFLLFDNNLYTVDFLNTILF